MAEVTETMAKIQMVDLVAQHSAYEKELNAAIQRVFAHSGFINGPEVKTFAQHLGHYLDASHVIPCANGTDALQIALMALNLKPGDEVITTSFNYVAAAEACALLGLKPVFVEVEAGTFNLDMAHLEAAVSSKTKAIIAVHLFGQACDMEALLKVSEKHSLFVIEDNAQSLGCEVTVKGARKKAGTVGHLGTTSFFPTKNLGCMGDGGALYTQDEALAATCKSIGAHGQGQRYEFKQIGINSRLDTLQAALLDIKLAHLAPSLEKRAWAARSYEERLSPLEEIVLPEIRPHSSHTYNQFTLKVKKGKRDALKEFLGEKGIPTMVYYPKPLHLQPAFSFLGYRQGALPVSETLCQEVLSLPIHPTLTESQIDFISMQLKAFFERPNGAAL